MNSLLDYFFPPRCPICEAIRLPWEDICCAECREKLVYVGESTCYRCGKPVADSSIEYCFDCAKKPRTFDRGYSVFVYEDVIKESMMKFKFLEREPNGLFYAEEIFNAHGEVLRGMKAAAVIPVPIHGKKLRKRGYNQAEVIARALGRKIDVPVWSRVLRRNRYTMPQKSLNDVERLRNLLQAFEVNEKEANRKFCSKDETVLLVDDIFTTGSTLEACARILKKAGAMRVVVVTVCIGSGY